MKRFLSRFLCFLLCLCILLGCTACGVTSAKLSVPETFESDHKKVSHDSYTAAENDRYQLIWDKENLRISLYDKVKDKMWCNTPSELLETQYDEDGNEIIVNPKLDSSIILEYYETQNYTLKTLSCYTASLKKGNYIFEPVENGFRITYYFDTVEISFPVEYTLNENGFSIQVFPTELRENGEKALAYRIYIAPFMCGIKIGSSSNDNYLFVPSGNGALMYADETNSEVSLSYSEMVYGPDDIEDVYSLVDTSNKEEIKLPVYGAKMGNEAMLAVISEGAETATIDADMANNTIGYSAVYSTFILRSQQHPVSGIYSRDTIIGEEVTSSKMKVDFYPLYDEEADYSGMAKVYRNYLTEKYSLKPTETDVSTAVRLLGGTVIPTSFLGVPTNKLFATTTVNEAASILKDLNDSIDGTLIANLVGFGESGVDIGRIAGNYKIGKTIGKVKQVKELSSMCDENNIPLFFDYDIIRYNKNGRGITTVNGGAAISTTYQFTKVYTYKYGIDSKAPDPHYYTSRTLLSKYFNLALENAATMNIKGVAFDTLSNHIYCDFRDNKYVSKGNMGADVIEMFNSAKNSGYSVLSNSATEYSAVSSDYMVDVPTNSSKNYMFDAEVPFYQMVFKGLIPMYSKSLNTIADTNTHFLQSIESGSGLSYTLTNNYDVDLMTSKIQVFSNTLYEDLKDDIVKYNEASKDYYKAVAGATIEKHEILSEFVRKTTYSNGYAVYVNYGVSDFETGLGTLKAGSFIYGKEA